MKKINVYVEEGIEFKEIEGFKMDEIKYCGGVYCEPWIDNRKLIDEINAKKEPAVIIIKQSDDILGKIYTMFYQSSVPRVTIGLGIIGEQNICTIYFIRDLCLVRGENVEVILEIMQSKNWWRSDFWPFLGIK